MNVWKKHKGKFEKVNGADRLRMIARARKIMRGNRLSKHG